MNKILVASLAGLAVVSSGYSVYQSSSQTPQLPEPIHIVEPVKQSPTPQPVATKPILIKEEVQKTEEAPKPEYHPSCCKICSTGKACGDSCISRSYTCHKGAGCACDG